MATATKIEHLVRMPKAYSVCIIIQILFAAVVFGLLMPCDKPAYLRGDESVPGLWRFLIFVAMDTIIVGSYYLVSSHLVPSAFNCWAWLICSVWQLMLWVSLWVDITSYVGNFAAKPDRRWSKTIFPRMIGASAFSGVVMVLTIVCLIQYSKAVNRHRQSGAPYVIYGRWRYTRENPSANPRNFNTDGSNNPESGGQVENGYHTGEPLAYPTMPPQSYEMNSQAYGHQAAHTKDF